jgi:hypothetical protein
LQVFLLVFCVFLLCVSTFCVPCCDVRYDSRMGMMFGSSLPPVICKKIVSCLFRFCLTAHSGVQHILLCFCFGFLRLVYLMLPVSLDCQY